MTGLQFSLCRLNIQFLVQWLFPDMGINEKSAPKCMGTDIIYY